MSLLLIWVFMIAAISATERRSSQYLFSLISLNFLSTSILLVSGELVQATLFAALVATLIVGASAIKHHHSGLKLAISDLALTFSGTLPFIVRQYRQTAIMAILSGLALALAALMTAKHSFGPVIPFDLRLGIFLLSAMLWLVSYRLIGGARYFRPLLVERGGYLSSFMASLIDISSWWRTDSLRFIDIANDPLDIRIGVPTGKRTDEPAGRPDLMMIQHESVFDPRIFGLPIDADIARFFSPSTGLSGQLNVEIYGGGSWQTEFSMLTGLSARSFGADSYFIFKKGAGRFQHSLPLSLLQLGYRTMLVAGCRRNFMNYDAFYESVGVKDRVFIDDLPKPFDVEGYEKTGSDAMFFEATRRLVAERCTDDTAPLLTIVLTNFNHGPHFQRRVAPDSFDAARAFALESLEDTQYGEYYARLAETAASWDRLRTDLGRLDPERQMLAIHYGDHQPVLTRRIERGLKLTEDNRRHLKTFYAIEGINMEPVAMPVPPGAPLDVAFLGTMALQAAGLPLDWIFATRAGLFYDCGSAYFNSTSERKKRFHRSLVDLGVVDCGPL
jgi:hypothetical protein